MVYYMLHYLSTIHLKNTCECVLLNNQATLHNIL